MEQSAAVKVCGFILVLLSVVMIYKIIKDFLTQKYPAAQKFLIVIYSIPIFIGWAS